MRAIQSIRTQLHGFDGKDYGAYQSLLGAYRCSDFDLLIDQIPKDPYAPPHTGIYRIRILSDKAGLQKDMYSTRIRRIALCDYLTRRFYENSSRFSKRRGTGNSGIITIARPGQEILERTAIIVNEDFLEARIFLGLPAAGRSITSKVAEAMIFTELPKIIRASLFIGSQDSVKLHAHLQTAENAEYLRNQLDKNDLVAFISDEAVLPRISSVDTRPMDTARTIPFKSPPSLRITFRLPDRGMISGMGIPEGVTLIVGGGYHGKSTLLQALEKGIYNHIAGDGREYCVSLPETVKVRAYSGRFVVNTDISSFIGTIPLQSDTATFSSLNASGSTSQAACISESIEAGARVLLMDEDTCATNFMIRDRRMQQLVPKRQEPITAFVDIVRPLYENHGISTVLVLGGAGDYLGVADQVIKMVDFSPQDVTGRAQQIVAENPSGRRQEAERMFSLPKLRIAQREGLEPKNEHGHRRIYAPHTQELIFGKMKVDLRDVDQLAESGQTKAIGLAIEYARKYMDGKNSLKTVLHTVKTDLEKYNLDLLDPKCTGDLTAFRMQEFAAVLNRMRDFVAVQHQPGELNNHSEG